MPSPRGLEFTAAGGVNPKVGGTSLDGTLAGVRPVQPLSHRLWGNWFKVALPRSDRMRTQDSGLQNEGRGLLAGAWWKMSGKGKPDWESLTGILCQLALPFPALTHSATCWLSVELPHCRKLEGKTFHSVRQPLDFLSKNYFAHFCICPFLSL